MPGNQAAAVLVPLFEAGGETRVVLTRRSSHLRNHRGDVAFPGGRQDPGDEPGWTIRLDVDDQPVTFCRDCDRKEFDESGPRSKR